jgi:nucleotide-binding universal stress UspA family protein
MKVLVAMDGSQTSVKAARFALNIAAVSRGSLVAFAVGSRLPLDFRGRAERFEQEAWRSIQTALEKVRRDGARRGVRVQTESVRAPRFELVAETIARTADRLHGDLVVVGSHGGSPLTRWALGSIANRLVHVSGRPVAVVRSWRGRSKSRPWRVLVATDGSRSAAAAVRFGARLVSAIPRARLTLLTVSTLVADVAMTGAGIIRTLGILPELERADRAAARRVLRRAAKQAGLGKRVTLRDYRPRQLLSAEEGIIAQARRDRADVIVMGRTGRSALGDVVVGSVAQRVLALAGRPVVLAPAAAGRGR